MAKNNGSRPTVNSVNRKVDELRKETMDKLVIVRQQLDEANRHVRHLEQEGKRKNSGMSGQITRNTAEIQRLNTLYEKLVQQLDDIKSSDNPIVSQGNLMDLESINNRLDAFDHLDEKVRKLREDMDAVQADIAGHDIRITHTERMTHSLDRRVGNIDHRVSILETIRDKVSWTPLVVGLIIAAITLWVRLAWVSREYVAMVREDGTEIVADLPHFVLLSWMLAIGLGAIAAGILYAVLRNRKVRDSEESYQTAEVIDSTPTPRQQSAAEETPTTVLPQTEAVHAGAPNGAR